MFTVESPEYVVVPRSLWKLSVKLWAKSGLSCNLEVPFSEDMGNFDAEAWIYIKKKYS